MSVPDRLTAALADRYRIERELGQGGMATVYLAEDVRHRRKVAIKVLHPELSAVIGSERFLKEIELTANLQHPHILPLFDSGAADGLLYYVMPFVEGESLRTRLTRDKQLSIGDAVRIASEVASALDYAHRRSVIHRDIKPENILLHDGRAVVADFGIALAVVQAGGSRMTQTGMSLGTPQYMSPEQAMGEREISARSDLYALGCVTYEMLTGEPPFTGPTAQAIVARVMTEEPRSITLQRNTVPPQVEEAVLIALAKLPADRWGTAAEFAAALSGGTAVGRYVGKGTRASATVLPSYRPTVPLLAGLLLGAGLGGLAVWAMRSRTPAASELPVRFYVQTDSLGLRLACCGQMFAVSPDGKRIVMQLATNPARGSWRLYVRELSDLTLRALPGTDGATSLSFSPDGEEIAFVSDRILRRVPVSGGPPQVVAALPDGFTGGTTWLDRETVVVAVAGLLHRVTGSGGSLGALFPKDSTRREATAPFFLEGTDAMLYVAAHLSGPPEVRWADLKSGRTKRVVSGASPTYLKDQRRLLAVRADGILLAWPFDPGSGDTTGAPIRVAENITTRSPVGAYAEYAISQNGTLVLTPRIGSGNAGIMHLVQRDGRSAPLALPLTADHYDGPAFSHDGRRIAFAATPSQAGAHSAYTYGLDDRALLRVSAAAEAQAVGWTDTGDSLIYQVGPDSFMVAAANRGGGAQSLFRLRDWVALGAQPLAVHGSWLALEVERRSGAVSKDIVLAHRDSGGVIRPYAATASFEGEPAISPDGQWIAFSSNETGQGEVYLGSFPEAGARSVISIDGGSTPLWSGDSRTVYYLHADTAVAAALGPGRPPVVVGRRILFSHRMIKSWTVDPSGNRFVIVDIAPEAVPLGFQVVLHALPPR